MALAAVLALSTGQMATGQMATGQAATGPGFVLIAFLALAYGAVLMADNSAILVGTIQSSPAERRGAAIATQTFLAATMALISPLAIGAVLDSLGAGATAWSIAFLVMGLGPAIGALVLLAPLAGRRDRDEKE